jgi:hypothetical protein
MRAWIIRILGVAIVAAVMAATIGDASALNFKCVNRSLYRNLLRVFNEDTSLFQSWFGVERRRMPPYEKCRAMVLSGTLKPGDAETLIGAIADTQGWLSVLYLAFDSNTPDEEFKVANVVRAFSLSTRAVNATVFTYAVDFATTWSPLTVVGSSTASPQDVSIIDPGMRNFNPTRVVVTDPKPCLEGCMLVWAAGINRSVAAAWADGTPLHGGQDTGDERIRRLRRAFAVYLDSKRLPAPNNPILAKPIDAETWPLNSAEADKRLRTTCQAEIGGSVALEGRANGAFAGFAKDNFGAVDIAPLLTAFGDLRRGRARLQRCLADANESARIEAFDQQCGTSTAACDKRKVADAMNAAVKDFTDKSGRLDPPKPDVTKPDVPKPDTAKPDVSQAAAPKPVVPKPVVPKPVAPKPEVPKPIVPKPDAPKP